MFWIGLGVGVAACVVIFFAWLIWALCVLGMGAIH
jgi:hypothetical protein